MLLKNAIKQLVRTPTRTVLFTLLIMLCSLFMTAGISLYTSSVQNIEVAKTTFRTIGTIEQKSDATGIEDYWDYINMEWKKTTYLTYLNTVETAQLANISCIQPPEKREFYLAYAPQLNPATYGIDMKESNTRRTGMNGRIVFEFTPQQTFIIAEPHFVDVVKYLYEPFSDKGHKRLPTKLLLCLQTAEIVSGEKTVILEAGKRYIASTYSIRNTPEQTEAWGDSNLVLVVDSLIGWQRVGMTENVECISAIAEVTEDFANTEVGRAFEQEVAFMVRLDSTVPVQATQDHALLLPFLNREAKLARGRAITQEEYDSKAMVCMIPDKLAHFAGLSIGDSVQLALYEVDRRIPPSKFFIPSGSIYYNSILPADGYIPDFFDTPSYQIVGTYSYFETTDDPSGYELAPNLIILPSGTVQNTDTAFAPMNGPMLGCTTSFEIANGSAEQFMTEIDKLGLTNLEVRFYDGGYTSVMKGLTATKRTALILTAISVVCCIGISLLYVFMQVSRRRAEAGIERSLGFTQRQSMASLYLTTMPVAALGATLGSVAGGVLSGQLNSLIQEMAGQQLFNPLFGTQVNAADSAASFVMSSGSVLLPAIASAVLVLLIALLLTAMLGRGVVRLTPMQLLSTKEQ